MVLQMSIYHFNYKNTVKCKYVNLFSIQYGRQKYYVTTKKFRAIIECVRLIANNMHKFYKKRNKSLLNDNQVYLFCKNVYIHMNFLSLILEKDQKVCAFTPHESYKNKIIFHYTLFSQGYKSYTKILFFVSTCCFSMHI